MSEPSKAPTLDYLADMNVQLAHENSMLKAELAKQRDENMRISAEGMVDRYAALVGRFADMTDRMLKIMERERG